MARIRGRDTRPELVIRRGLHARGYRYRLHERKLPGRPDLVFPARRAAILVHGCFWHGHDCHLFRWPDSRAAFWREKIGRNRERDVATRASLQDAGWRVLEIWECALKGRARRPADDIIAQSAAWLDSSARCGEIRGIANGAG